MRTFSGALGLFLIAALLVSAGCNRPSNVTSKKGAGGLPMQNYDGGTEVIAWEVPAEYIYPNWKQFYPDNNRIYLVPDTVETVAKWYKERVPDAVQEDVNGKRHIIIKNKDIEIDIESGGDQTKIAITPLDIQLQK